MRIQFATDALRELCNKRRNLKGRFGPNSGSMIERRLAMLAVAPTLADVSTHPPEKLRNENHISKHPFSVDAATAGRIFFSAFAGSEPSCVHEQIDTIKITDIGGARDG